MFNLNFSIVFLCLTVLSLAEAHRSHGCPPPNPEPSDCGTNGGGTAAGLKQVGNGLGGVVTGAVDVVGGVVHTATGLVGDVIHVKGGGGGGGGGDNCEEPEPTPEKCD